MERQIAEKVYDIFQQLVSVIDQLTERVEILERRMDGSAYVHSHARNDPQAQSNLPNGIYSTMQNRTPGNHDFAQCRICGAKQ